MRKVNAFMVGAHLKKKTQLTENRLSLLGEVRSLEMHWGEKELASQRE